MASSSLAGPLAALIRRHKAGRSYEELAEAAGGVIPAGLWEELERQPPGDRVAIPSAEVEALAVALGLSEPTVRHYVLASRGLPVTIDH
jgi:hypothetical protein